MVDIVLTCPSKFRPLNVLGYRSEDLNQEEIQRRENHQSSKGGGRRHHDPGCLQETPDHRTDFVSLADLTLYNRILRDVNQKSGEAVGARRMVD